MTFWLLCMYKSRLSRDKVDPWQRPFYDVFWVPSCFQVLFEFQKALFKFFSWRVSSKQSYCFAFNETTFYAWWVARGEVRKLEGLGRLVKSFDGFWSSFSSFKTFISVMVVVFVIGKIVWRLRWWDIVFISLETKERNRKKRPWC